MFNMKPVKSLTCRTVGIEILFWQLLVHLGSTMSNEHGVDLGLGRARPGPQLGFTTIRLKIEST